MLLTINQAKNYRKKSGYTTTSILKIAESREKKTVFLSHSSTDIELLSGVIEFLECFGALVYIDKNDRDLPRVTSPETARLLKQRIGECPKFIVLVTENTSRSKWIPWELGLADVLLTEENVAILPVVPESKSNPNSENWTTQEYLGLYRRIGKWKLDSEWEWCVELPDDRKKAEPLDIWLGI